MLASRPTALCDFGKMNNNNNNNKTNQNKPQNKTNKNKQTPLKMLG